MNKYSLNVIQSTLLSAFVGCSQVTLNEQEDFTNVLELLVFLGHYVTRSHRNINLC